MRGGIIGIASSLACCFSRNERNKASKYYTRRSIMSRGGEQSKRQKLDNSEILPSSLISPPTRALVTPGNCQFSSEFTPVSLLEKFQISPTSTVLRFGLPDKNKSLGLSTCACLLAGANISDKDDEEEMVIRPYTPISTNAMIGSFDLLIKTYKDGKMSSFLTSLEPSEKKIVQFKHIPFNVKIQFPFKKAKFIGMIAGGTGITPMIQALHALLDEDESNNHESSVEKISLLYGSRNSEDILGEELLGQWSKTCDSMLSVTHVLSDEKKDSGWDNGKRGFINREIIEETFPCASEKEDVLIFVCGPPAMYNAICGPRDETKITGILGELGYTEDQVYKF